MKLISKFTFTILCTLFSVLVFGQEFLITGKILDEGNQPIAYANILVLKAQDSTIVTGTTSDDFGKFTTNTIDAGNYTIKVSFIGYQSFSQSVTLNDNLVLEDIVLTEALESLNQVELTYIKPTIKKEADRLVFNVENTALIEGNILEVLRSTPRVLIFDNNILVKNTTPAIYINDRKVHLSIEEVVELLEGSTASNIKSIEVITNPPPRYDAESGVVLNIVMNKNLVTGYNGSLFSNYTQGVFPKQNYGISNFFKSSKINFSLNYSYNYKKDNRDDIDFVDYTTEIWNSDKNRNSWSETHNVNMNFDYFINEHNTLSFSANTQFLPYFKYRTKNNTSISDPLNVLQSKFVAQTQSQKKKNNLGFDFGYIHSFKKDDSKLSFSSHYTSYDNKRKQNVNSDYFLADDTFLESTAFNTKANQDTEIITAQLDYSLPINKTSSFETGIKSSQIKTESDILQNDIINNQEVLNISNTDAFNYDETIFAGYLSYEKKSDKWNISGGLRVEQTNIEGQSILNNQINKQDYLDWFLTGNISHKVSEKIDVYANYKQSIQRPSYTDLNPFKFFFNDNTFVAGNPNLQPVYIDHITLGASISNNYTFEAYYKVNNGNVFELPLQDNNNNTTAYTPINIDKSTEFGFDFLTFFNVTKKWSIAFVTSFYNTEDEAVFNDNRVKLDQWSNFSQINNNFSFLKDNSLTANFTIIYSSKNIQGLQEVSSAVFSTLSINKKVFKNRGVFSLVVSDLFNDQNFFITTKYLDQNSTNFINLDNRYIKLGFRYKFGNTKLKTNERTSDQEELDRLLEERY